MTAITHLTGVEIAQAVRSRKMSAREISEAFLGRIAELNPTVNAICTLNPAAIENAADFGSPTFGR